jgi:hypothetical protein
MKTSRGIQYIAAAILFSVAGICELVHLPAVGWIVLAMIVTAREEGAPPISRRRLSILWTCLAIAFVMNVVDIAIAIIYNKPLIPKLTGGHFLHDSGFVFPFWLLLMFLLFMAWRRERKLPGQ